MTKSTVVFEAIEQMLSVLPLEERVSLLQRLLDVTVREAAMPHARPQPGAQLGDQHGKVVAHPLDDLTYRITGCAMAVHSRLGCSLREVNYQRALELELEQAGLAYRPQQQLAVYDTLQSHRLLGYCIPDFVVEDAVVVEIKALGALSNAHVAQVISYLAVTGCSVGLLINFGEHRLNWRRILPPRDLQSYRVNKQWLWNPFAKPNPDKPALGYPQADKTDGGTDS